MRQADAIRQPPEYKIPALLAIVADGLVEPDGKPHGFVIGKLHSRPHHSDNGFGVFVNPDCLADDMGVAVVAALP